MRVQLPPLSLPTHSLPHGCPLRQPHFLVSYVSSSVLLCIYSSHIFRFSPLFLHKGSILFTRFCSLIFLPCNKSLPWTDPPGDASTLVFRKLALSLALSHTHTDLHCIPRCGSIIVSLTSPLWVDTGLFPMSVFYCSWRHFSEDPRLSRFCLRAGTLLEWIPSNEILDSKGVSTCDSDPYCKLLPFGVYHFAPPPPAMYKRNQSILILFIVSFASYHPRLQTLCLATVSFLFFDHFNYF